MNAAARPLRTYGRIRSRTLKPRQARLMESLLPRLAIPERAFSPSELKPDAAEVWLEAGFGAGEHLVFQAEHRPDALLLGAEPFVNGLAACLARIDDAGVGNVRLHPGDVRVLMECLPAACLTRIFVLFPDPWPKARHAKRRLVEPGFIAEAARLLKPGGELRFATDWADYADWTLRRFLASPDFRWTAERAAEWRAPPP
ncbi:MAG: tRNA (guanosine(46)-N7)-methyltransferase TrmB, partial [Caulobacteraceae bacterium]